MHRTPIGWVIYGGRHCRKAKIFQPFPAGNQTWSAGSTGKHSTMGLLQGSIHEGVNGVYWLANYGPKI